MINKICERKKSYRYNPNCGYYCNISLRMLIPITYFTRNTLKSMILLAFFTLSFTIFATLFFFLIMIYNKSNDYLKKSPVYGHFRKTAA